MSSSRNRKLHPKNKQLSISTRQTTTSSSNKPNLVLSDLCINQHPSTQRKSLTTLADTEIGNSKFSYTQNKRFSLCTSENLELKDRHDAHGNPIFKGNKNHKVTFIDDVSRKNLAEVIIVDSENSNKNKQKNDTDKTNCQCETGCLIC